MDNVTEQAMADPQIGDRFQEMMTHWVYVCDRTKDDIITTVEGSGNGIGFPVNAKVRQYESIHVFQTKFRFITQPGYYIALHDRKNDVRGWITKVILGDDKPSTEA